MILKMYHLWFICIYRMMCSNWIYVFIRHLFIRVLPCTFTGYCLSLAKLIKIGFIWLCFLHVRTPEGLLWHTASVCDFLLSTQKDFCVRFRPIRPRINQWKKVCHSVCLSSSSSPIFFVLICCDCHQIRQVCSLVHNLEGNFLFF